MERVPKIALRNILTAAEGNPSFSLGDVEKETLVALKRLCNDGSDEMHLEDLSAYEGKNLWGFESLWTFLESGAYQIEFNNLTEEEQAAVAERAFASIDWAKVEDAAENAGNKVIADALDCIMES